jgi:protease I
MSKILIITGDGVEALELMYPYQRLLEEGYDVDIAAPSAKMIQTVVHDVEPGWDTYSEKKGYRVEANLAFSDVKVENYIALVIPGGRAPEYIRNDSHVKRIVRWFFDKNLPVAHICHAPLVLAAAGVLKGRSSAGFPFVEPDIENAGGVFVDGAGVVDGNMVSARAWFDHPAWMREFMILLRGKVASPSDKNRGHKQNDPINERIARLERRINQLEK